MSTNPSKGVPNLIQSKSSLPKLPVRFYRSTEGREPVRDWLKALPDADRKKIGDEIRVVQFGWPVGMPLVRRLGADLWEVRVTLPSRRARVLFTLEGDAAVLLNGFIKQSQKTPKEDLELAQRRLKTVQSKT